MKPPLQSLSGMVFFYTIFLAGMPNVFAQDWTQIIKLTAQNNGGSSARSNSDFYGQSVAVSGNYAIVGAYFEDEDADGLNTVSSAGSAYILYNNAGTWVQVKKIVAPVRETDDLFGQAVSISGDYAIVGAPSEDEDGLEANTLSSSGSVYIFKRNQGGTDNWGLVKKITASARAEEDKFGYALSISGDYVIVGAYQEDEDENEANTLNLSGSAYIFKKDQGGADNWGQIRKITAAVRGTQDWFGFAVAISGDYAIVGAQLEKEDTLDANPLNFPGAAYIFKKDQGGADNWGQIKKIAASDRANNDLFGWSVAIHGDYAIVGTTVEDEDAAGANTLNSAGSAYIFKKDLGGADNWGELRKITATVRGEGDNFGVSVAIAGDYIIVGAYQEDDDLAEANGLNGAGSAYIFKKDEGGPDNWGAIQKITASIRGTADNFGMTVGIDGDYIIVGAHGDSEDASEANTLPNAGSACIFHLGPPLPVTLITFEAIENENQALLSWITAMESHSRYFDIQKSNDGRSWKTLGRVGAARESDLPRSYTFADNNVLDEDSPRYEWFYRLKMVDMDGGFAYSRIIGLSFGNNRRSMLYPNPVSDKLSCNPADAGKIMSIAIVNSAGQVVFQVFTNISAGIPVNGLVPGVYQAEIRKKTGAVQFQKIVVAR